MSVLAISDEQQYIFNVNEEFDSIPMKISYSMKFSKSFTKEEICSAVEKCINTADVFAARCVVKEAHPYIEFLPYQKKSIPVFDFSSEEEYQMFCRQSEATNINNRDRLYYIFIFSIAGSFYHIHFIFNHLIFDGVSGLLLSEKIQEALIEPGLEIKWHPFSAHLEGIKNYYGSEKYLSDKEFWRDRFLEISKSEYLFSDVIDRDESLNKSLSFHTSRELKELLLEYCNMNNVSPYILIITVLAQIINDKTGCKCFYFEIPIANRLGKNEKNSLGAYVTTFPFIFDFTRYNNISDLLKSVYKQSKDYYKHKNFDWNSKINSESNEKEYGRYIPQLSFSYFCNNKKPSVSFATLHHQHPETDVIPMALYISDYLDWQTMTFSYTYWGEYFTDEEVANIHQDIEAVISNIISTKI